MNVVASPRYWLAPRTSAHKHVPGKQKSFSCTFRAIPKRLHCEGLMPLPNPFRHHR
jgi:hypothetical protein